MDTIYYKYLVPTLQLSSRVEVIPADAMVEDFLLMTGSGAFAH
jgi:hypothetical protein